MLDVALDGLVGVRQQELPGDDRGEPDTDEDGEIDPEKESVHVQLLV
ncbi:MAG TPA: hypothetical protein VH165_17415 [Kofleriaceae bacterium]|nr:hypothetical protein [Kofleriaceae bacterium]